MTRARLLLQNEGHERAQNTDFMKRLCFKKAGEVALKSDCINLAMQYVFVYQALEARLVQLCTRLDSYLTVFIQNPWAGRSEHLQKDITVMKSFLSPEEQACLIDNDYLFPATLNMINGIGQANHIELFSWLTVRCLDDAFGGQDIKKYTQRVFGKNVMTAFFSNIVSNQDKSLEKIVNQTDLSKDEELLFHNTADTIFQLHVELSEEMEQKRVLPKIQAKQQFAKPVHASYSTGFKLLMFATIAASVAIPIVNSYCSATGPQK